jgi:hypothetical protein
MSLAKRTVGKLRYEYATLFMKVHEMIRSYDSAFETPVIVTAPQASPIFVSNTHLFNSTAVLETLPELN